MLINPLAHVVLASALIAAPLLREAGAAGITAPAAHIANVQVSHDRFLAHAMPRVAVNPRNPENLLGASKVLSTQEELPFTYVSLDGGRTWRDNGALPLPHGFDRGSSDLDVAFDAQGHAFVAAAAIATTNSQSAPQIRSSAIFFWRSPDGGQHFSAPVAVGQGNHFQDAPDLAVDTAASSPYAGSIYLLFNHYVALFPSPRPGGVYLAVSRDGGLTFTTPRRVSGPPTAQQGAIGVAVGPGGTLYVLFADVSDPTGVASLQLVRSIDGGRHFSAPVQVASGRWPQTVAWIHDSPALAIDPRSGTLYVTIKAFRPGTQQMDVQVLRSADGGRTWSAPTPVTGDLPVASAQTVPFEAQPAVGATGTLYVSYYLLTRRGVDVYLTRSTDRGAHFAPRQRITTTSFDPARNGLPGGGDPYLGDFQGLAVGGGLVHPFWTDTRTGHLQIFTAAVPGA
jgi:hypothetical protein